MISIPNAYYPNLVSAVDAVLTKPGYGILSECYFSKQKILYTERGDFIEYPYLVNALENFFQSKFISNEELFSLRFEKKFQDLKNSNLELNENLIDGFQEIFSEIFLLN